MSVNPADLGGPYASVFDVGAFRGDFARACLAEWPDAGVESFEPLEERKGPGDPRWAWHRCALGASAGLATMTRCTFVPSSSVLPMAALHEQAFPYTKGGTEVEVGMARLDEFAALIREPALLKIDVQGYELEVMRGAGAALWRFDGVVLEVSHAELYHGAPTPEELAAALQGAGFTHQARVDELAHPKTKVLLQSDEFWARA
jgi:FkbM family methyltransferase